MASAYVDEELKNMFLIIERRNVILLRLATAATITLQGGCQPQASLGVPPRDVLLKTK